MSRSGYPASWREDAVKSAIASYEKMVEDDKKDIRPLFRPNTFKEEERRLGKLKKKKLWHKAGREENMLAGAPLVICPSDGDQISKKMRKVCKQFKEEHNIDVKICERGGRKLGSIVKSDPLKPQVCGRGDCFPCSNEGGGDCSKSCAAYKLECQECPKSKLSAVYHGETGRNAYSRGLEHFAGLQNRKEDNPLWKHCLLQHHGQQVKFKIICLKSFKTAFMRQINEGVRIACCTADICMNSKSEFHQPSIIRVSANLGNLNEEQTGLQPQEGARGRRGRGNRSRGARSRGARSRGSGN